MILGFKDRFVAFVLDGSKRHTIRAGGRWRAGMRADLFSRPRQKDMRLLFRAPVHRVETISIRTNQVGTLEVRIKDYELTWDERRTLFYRDGFRDGDPSTAALEFWRDRLPFEGQIIHWDFDKRELPK